jgi:hypothetical protein
MQLDHVRPLDLAQIRPAAALANPQPRLERIEREALRGIKSGFRF